MPHPNAPADANSLRALAAAVTHASRAAETGSLIRGILEACARPGGALAAALTLPDGSRLRLWVQRPGASGAMEEPSPSRLDCLPPSRGHDGEPRLLPVSPFEVELALHLRRTAHCVEVALPSRQGGGASLLLFLPGPAERLSGLEREFARAMAQVVSLGLERLRAQRRLGIVATRDDLTHAFNYRFLKTALRKELARSARRAQPLSVIMLDVDQLKHYNDRFGHLLGSALLRDMAQLLKRELRGVDWVAKYGGDEFLVILPSTDKLGAAKLADRLRRAVCEHAFDRAQPGEVTVSLGVACFPADGEMPLALIEAADRALYSAKWAGRNRTHLAGGRAGEPDLAA
ncbi:MAG: GGDEF domain-containing protein [Candidatus Eisenbacteria bacterium]|nr:GGDEF domain-containing protein [Candidatus Eisenbacteria bacterium]